MRTFTYICLSAFFVLSSIDTDAQVAALKDGAKLVLKSVAKKNVKREVTKETKEELIKFGIKETGGKYTGEALCEQVVKRAAREKAVKLMEKEGVESFLSYGSKRSAESLAKTEMSVMKGKITAAGEKKYLNAIAESRKSVPTHANVKNPVTVAKEGYLSSKLKKTQTYKTLLDIQAKGPIKLTEKQIQQLAENKSYLRSFILTYTGDKKNFQEFFIRLAMYDKKAVERILSNKEIMEYVKNSMIRSGGVHEWLMAKNFKDFLVNPKWGDDGPFLALSLTKLVQKTDNVVFKFGGMHGSTNSTKFHNGLAEVIDKCSSKEELFLSVKNYAKKNLTPEAYKEFKEIYISVFLKAA